MKILNSDFFLGILRKENFQKLELKKSAKKESQIWVEGKINNVFPRDPNP